MSQADAPAHDPEAPRNDSGVPPNDPDAPPDDDRRDLTSDTVRGALWAFATMGAGRVVSLAGLVVLARLLSPEHFGLLAFATLFITYVETLGDLGTGAALIYWPERRDEVATATFGVNLAMGAMWTLAAWAAAPWVAAFFQQPEATAVLRAMAWIFPLRYLGNTHDALLQRELRFRTRAFPELGAAVVKISASVTLALQGFGVWSLVYGYLAGQAVQTATLWLVVPWRPSAWPSRDLLAGMLRYGRGLVAVDVLAALAHHLDRVVVGRAFGAQALGLYEVAYRVPRATLTTGTWVLGKVLFPAFSRASAGGGDIRRAYVAATRTVGLLAVPAAAGLALLSWPLTVTVLGPRWEGAAPILAALAVHGGLRALGTPAGEALKGTGRSGLLAALACFKVALLVPALLVGAGIGVVAVAATMAAVKAVTTVVDHAVAARQVGARLREPAGALATSAAAGTAMAMALLGWRAVGVPLRGAVPLVGAVALGATVYVAALAALDPELVRATWRRLRALVGSRGSPLGSTASTPETPRVSEP